MRSAPTDRASWTGLQRLAARTIGLLVPAEDRQAFLDDLVEESALLAARDPRAARRWVWQQLLRSPAPLLARRLGASTRRLPRGVPLMSKLWQDTRMAARSLRHTPLLTAIVVAVLALGIGANAAIFSLIAPFVVRPLPYPDAERLVHLFESDPRIGSLGWDMIRQSRPTLVAWQERADSVESIGGYFYADVAIRFGQAPARTETLGYLTREILPMLGTQPQLGRTFAPAEDVPGRDDVVLVSHDFWRGQLAADPAVVGETLHIDGRAHAIVGAMPPGFNFPFGAVRLWKPAALDAAAWSYDRRSLLTMAKLRAGVTRAAALEDLDAIRGAVASEAPEAFEGMGLRVVPLKAALVFFYDIFRALMGFLLLAAGLLLAVVCSNVANLMLSRAGGRQRQLAVCAALGAGRGRIIRQLLAESTILALLGAALALLIASWSIGAVARLVPAQIYRVGEIHLDGATLVYAGVAGLVAAVAFGLVPALRASRADLTATLREGGGAVPSRGRLSRVLVFAQVLLAAVLCGAAVLAAQAVLEMQRFDHGIDVDRAVAVELRLPADGYPDRASIGAFYDTARMAVAALPGVDAVGTIDLLPFGFASNIARFELPGSVDEPERVPEHAALAFVSPEYFAAMGIPTIAGERFAQVAGSGDRIVVNQMLASRLWPGRSGVGERLLVDWGSGERDATVIGVVAPSAGGFMFNGLEEQVFVSAVDRPSRRAFLIARTDGDPMQVAAELPRVFAGLDADLPLGEIQIMSAAADVATQPIRVASNLLAAFSAFAILLAALGIYGVASFAILRRRQEIGVRMALGAPAVSVVRLVIGSVSRMALGGAILGGLVTWALATGLAVATESEGAGLLPAMIVIALLVAVALLASWLPARRATRIDPVLALRTE